MMKEKISTNDNGPEPNLRFLLCDTTGDIGELSSREEERVSSPVQCLDRAVDRRPEIIVIYFGKRPIREREALVGLIAALKRNSHTQKCPVLALLHSKHREILEDLNRVGADFLTYVKDAPLDSNQIRDIIDRLGPNDRLKRHLAVLCPFLHYGRIDSQHEMTVCGAYLDRMVLGGRWLHDVCETEGHLQCDYYLNPRIRS
jgi:hypothetical protein